MNGKRAGFRKTVRGFARHKRHLPHIEVAGATYFITFDTAFATELSARERQVVFDAFLRFDKELYELDAVVVMPDHPHALLRPLETDKGECVSLSYILWRIKGSTAREINKMRGSSGKLWTSERMDRVVRGPEEHKQKLEYIVRNPEDAKLVTSVLDQK